MATACEKYGRLARYRNRNKSLQKKKKKKKKKCRLGLYEGGKTQDAGEKVERDKWK